MPIYYEAKALERAIDTAPRITPSTKSVLKKIIRSAPVADAEPVRHGKWLHTDYALHWTAKDECSECTYHALDRDDLSHYNYCPNCGARMDEEDIHE